MTWFLNFAASCECSLDQIKFYQTQAGHMVWRVTIENQCPSPIRKVTLACPGFGLKESLVDPKVLSQSWNECLVNRGLSINPNSSFNFTYVRDDIFHFTLLGALF